MMTLAVPLFKNVFVEVLSDIFHFW